MSAIAFDSHKELPGEHIVIMNKAKSLAALKRSVAFNKSGSCNRVNTYWPFMRVKNTIRALNPANRPPLRSHYDCLVFLASLRNISIEQLVQMNLKKYLGKEHYNDLYLKIMGRW
jgi:hypothetical protein